MHHQILLNLVTESQQSLQLLKSYLQGGIVGEAGSSSAPGPSYSVLANNWQRLAEELRRLGSMGLRAGAGGKTGPGPGSLTAPPDRALLNRVAVELRWGAEELKTRQGVLVRDAYRAAALDRLAGELAGWLNRQPPSTM